MSDSDSDGGNGAPGRGKLIGQHKRELKQLNDKCKIEMKRTKNKAEKREIEAKYKAEEEELKKKHADQLAELDNNKGEQGDDGAGKSKSKEPEDGGQESKKQQENQNGGDDEESSDDDSPKRETAAEKRERLAKEERELAKRKKEKAARKKANRTANAQAAKDERRKQVEAELATEVPHAKIEAERMATQLALHNPPLRTFDIASDGNCLYRAVAHQISQVLQPSIYAADAVDFLSCTSGSASKDPTKQIFPGLLKYQDPNRPTQLRPGSLDHEALRELTADFLLANREEFFPYLLANESLAGGGDFDEYVRRVRDEALWGGDMEINVLSQLLKLQIDVFQGSGEPVLRFGEEQRKQGNAPGSSGANLYQRCPAVRISYHKHLFASAHYNSLVPK